ncbi:molybdenum cofactor sulfurase [Platysternon megacephalum]|uniref:Molybdenum cofactor sulfurase n=1 Tax=Platysternon megacephalum TaxID=55544 RepID=A0A4D9DFD1_9SAUR|nr:molybdenum cofactor sulfurase [Platysternon megacephalum]
MCLYLANELTSKSATDNRVKNVLGKTVIWIIPMQNPDGAMYDIKGGRFQSWRKNRQPVGYGYYGVDLNRNYGYKWGGQGSSGTRSSETYRGTAAESGVEVKRVADFVRGREGKIKTHVDVHTYSELVLWPFGYTHSVEMPAEDYALFQAMGKKMADTNGFSPEKSSDLYLTSGDSTDWMYGSQKIWSYTFELAPKMGNSVGFYPKASAIAQETSRNREAFMLLWENTDCLWRVVGKESKCVKR